MASNAKNLAELLNQDSTVAVGDIADGSVTTAKLADNAVTSAKALNLGRRNLIINGAMMLDQRNSGSAVSAPHNTYTLDRLNTYQSGDGAYSVQQVTDVVPDGFSHSAKIACTTADTNGFGANDYYMLTYNIEYNQTRSLQFGTSNAKNVTLSFYVRSNLTGTFSGALESGDGGRHRVFEYTISSANTWERKEITIPGDTTGTWTGTYNARGMKIRLALALGANYDGTAGTWGTDESYGSTNQTNFLSSTSNVFYITGLQLEEGSSATDFEHRLLGEELSLCQRYCEIIPAGHQMVGRIESSSNNWSKGQFSFKTTKRSGASMTVSHTDASSPLMNVDWTSTNFTSAFSNLTKSAETTSGITFRLEDSSFNSNDGGAAHISPNGGNLIIEDEL